MTTLTGQDIGRAHHATRAVLERHLALADIDFVTSVILNLLNSRASGAPQTGAPQTGAPQTGVTPAEIEAALMRGLKIDVTEARAALQKTLAAGLVEPGIQLTAKGVAVQAQVTAAIAAIVERLYGGIPAADLAVTQRVLATVTARADAALEQSA